MRFQAASRKWLVEINVVSVLARAYSRCQNCFIQSAGTESSSFGGLGLMLSSKADGHSKGEP